MKKIFSKTISLILTSIVLIGLLTLANPLTAMSETEKACKTTADCAKDQVCENKVCKSTINVLMPRPGKDEKIRKQYKETTAVSDLPDLASESLFASIIKSVLKVTMVLTIIAIVVAAVYYLQAQGKEEDLSKAKSIIIYLLIGIAIMASAYALVSGIAQFDFFKTTP